jgi:hypothetical protein
MNFEKIISRNGIFLNISLLSFPIFFDFEEIIFEKKFNISENNIISVELAKVLELVFAFGLPRFFTPFGLLLALPTKARILCLDSL